jgi:hypothetical protein
VGGCSNAFVRRTVFVMPAFTRIHDGKSC